MATTKKRINISVSNDVEKALESLAKRDEVPVATKAVQLLRSALEIEEDFALAKVADSRLDTVKKRIQISIQEKLLLDPITFGKPLRHSLKSIRSLRVGDYRVAFTLVRKEVGIVLIGHRSRIYTNLQGRVW